MKHVLVFGKNGQIANALSEAGRKSNIKVTCLGRTNCDLLENPDAARQAILKTSNIDTVINAAAYTDVDGAETDVDAATRLNSEAPAIMAKACAERGVPFMHISTDYVFSGNADAPYKPLDRLEPLNAYGRTKAESEKAVFAANPEASVFRTSWVYDAVHKNFLTTMLRLADERDSVSVVDDQVGRPTYAPHFAETLLTAAATICAVPEKSGLYNLTGEGQPVSWYEFAAKIFHFAGQTPYLKRITSAEFPRPAARPLYSVLDTSTFTETFDASMPPWESSLSVAMTIATNRA